MAKIPGYKGWKRKTEHHFQMMFKRIRVAEAKMDSVDGFWKASFWVKVGEFNDKGSKNFISASDARTWMNTHRRRISKEIFAELGGMKEKFE